MSALHRNPGISAKAVETLDEVRSGGRFVFGLGSGHAGGQAHAFGLPEDHVFGRFEEAIEIIVPLLRSGHADVEGTYHAARDLEHRPVGPRPGRTPIMIGAGGPRYAPPGRDPCRYLELVCPGAERRRGVRGRLSAALEAMCDEVGRVADDRTVGRHRRGADRGDRRGRSDRRAPPRLGRGDPPTACARSAAGDTQVGVRSGRGPWPRSRRWRRSSSCSTRTEPGRSAPDRTDLGAGHVRATRRRRSRRYPATPSVTDR